MQKINKLNENEHVLKIDYLDEYINVLATIKTKNLHIYEKYKKSQK